MAIIIKTAGVDYSGNNVGWYGEHLPAFGDALEWAGAFGDQWEIPSPDVYDYSMRARPGQMVGQPTLEDAFAVVGSGNYFETPISDAGLIAAGAANQFTLMAVIKGVPDSGTAAIISTLGTTAQSGFRLGIASGAGTLSLLADKGSENQSSITRAAGLAVGDPEFVAAVVDGLNVTLYRKGADDPSMLSSSGALALSGIEGRNVGWRIGESYSGTVPTNRVGMAGLYNRALTIDEVERCYLVAQRRMALRGETL